MAYRRNRIATRAKMGIRPDPQLCLKSYFHVTGRRLKEVRETQRALVELWRGLPELGGLPELEGGTETAGGREGLLSFGN